MKLVKVRKNPKDGDTAVSIPRDIRAKLPDFDFAEVSIVGDGILYRPMNISPAVVPTKDHAAEHPNEHILSEVVAND